VEEPVLLADKDGGKKELSDSSITPQYSKVHTGKHLSFTFPIQNGLEQEKTLSPLLFNFTLEHSVRNVQEKLLQLTLNGTHQPLVYANDVNRLGNKIDTTKKNTEH
jgi:hypothetical protein